MPVAVPVPGTLRLRLPGVGTIERRAHDCGTATIVVPRREATARASRGASLTFTPHRGSPYTRQISLR